MKICRNKECYILKTKLIVDKAIRESTMEKNLKEIDAIWNNMKFNTELHTRTQIMFLQASDELIETLEDSQTQIQTMLTSKYVGYYLKEVTEWQKKLSNAEQVLQLVLEVQRTWSHLESIFIGSEDIRNQLPEYSTKFDLIDKEFRIITKENQLELNFIKSTTRLGLCERLESLQANLYSCEKALSEYLETKRYIFPRFYFISSTDLLEILSNGNEPEKVQRSLTKLFDSIAKLKLIDEKLAHGMWSRDGEYVEFDTVCKLNDQVEVWLSRLLETQCKTVQYWLNQAIREYQIRSREEWILCYPAQVALTGSQIWWSREVEKAFSRLEEGFENSLKEYSKKQVSQLNVLITMLLSELNENNRQKIMTICTIDVHARDVISRMIANRTESSQEFLWQSQLRHQWDNENQKCYANICDAQIDYSYEYLGNQPRLVITPLTDRCYITLTQSLHLTMGGAPTGPAGTGKTETTKDLGRSLGKMVYVFNCSEQMDYQSCEAVYKGLAQTGAWGCFDEFNRIAVEVLSVVAVQVKLIQNALRLGTSRFTFMDVKIKLNSNVGIFITMNPGYAGRTELPENLKSLFRPCAMVVPDFDLICEIMLVAEGFTEARILACKFITFYRLCNELLSKQDHYDWGLRAIKSVLVVAGSLRRAERSRAEEEILMRALRDSNLPKIVNDDLGIFMGLIGDLFPAMDVPRRRGIDFEKQIKEASNKLCLQAEENFITKITQLAEILDVRHSVFIVGQCGTGKTQTWKTLSKTYQIQKKKPIVVDLNPKAITNDELFGSMNPLTREWKDGIFSTLMRDLSNMPNSNPKWIVLDGDVDPMWIESLNTVMDDNKVLTLASNERITLTTQMRLLFEVSNLKYATLATVSRAGILYINNGDLGWTPIVQSWIETRELHSEKSFLMTFFEKYCPLVIEVVKSRFKSIAPVSDVSKIKCLCNLLEVLLVPRNIPSGSPKELYEMYFVFACIWAFGGALYQDQTRDHRSEFSYWWINEFKSVKFPRQGTIFDYYINNETQLFEQWTQLLPKYVFDLNLPLQATQVPTSETIRIQYIINLLIEKGVPVMLVGNAGTGKTLIMNEKLRNLSENWLTVNVPFNYYTTSEMLQFTLEKLLEKKAGRNYGPIGNKRLIYFIDDFNVAREDDYGTVQPHSLIRQHLDYQHWYDRQKQSLKEIHNCQYVACMNPSAGSFTIDPRLQRHFTLFAISTPSLESLKTIFSNILIQYFLNGFSIEVQKFSLSLINVALAFHQRMGQVFVASAIKFHYVFNLRDLSNIFQGILYATQETVKAPIDLMSLYVHEAERVYSDKLYDKIDKETYLKLERETFKKLEELNQEEFLKRPLIYCHFLKVGEAKYCRVRSMQNLQKIISDALENYNELNAIMNLVLFDDAIMHICRINRIIELPYGNGLLIGVGGSGKQSLTRLAAWMSSFEVFQISLRKGYSALDLKLEFGQLYLDCGMKNKKIVFILSDGQVVDERFLVLVNDYLASGEISGLFNDDTYEEIISSIRNEIKSLGLDDSRDKCWKFFVNKVRRLLKVVLCFSPVGSTLRQRSIKFPALLNTTCIDWFHEWPEEALIRVAKKFLSEINELDRDIQESASLFMAHVHKSVNEASQQYLQAEKRYNYTTPKSFLEQISLYKRLLLTKRDEIQNNTRRLEKGLIKLLETSKKVDELKIILAIQEKEVKKKNEDADRLIQKVQFQTNVVIEEKLKADEEQKRVQEKSIEVAQKQQECEEDLIKAEPALIAAQEALNTLDKNNLTELKSFPNPPNAVLNVLGAVLCLFAPEGKLPRDRSWKAAKSLMGNVDSFLDRLKNYDKENIPDSSRKEVLKYINDPEFRPNLVKTKSFAAAGLCSWVINIIKFYDIYCDVAPKRVALQRANEELQESQENLIACEKRVKELEFEIEKLKIEYEEAYQAKLKVEAEARQTSYSMNLANRLIIGLSSEKMRWSYSVKCFTAQEYRLPGDILLITAFVSYLGYFSKEYRNDLLNKNWIPFICQLKNPIVLTKDIDVISILSDEVTVAIWNNEGLPSDRMSAENATILTNCDRWPLMIDPQLQGIKWIKTKYSNRLICIRLGQKGFLDKIEQALSYGQVLLIENIEENIDNILDPLISRNTIKKGMAIRIGDKEIEYNPKFRLILHTKLPNPHFKPEMQAQTTLINFTVTEDGLEDQLLADVVAKERPDLEEQRSSLLKTQNDYTINLKTLEDSLLEALTRAEGNFTADSTLVESLEKTKSIATEIEEKVNEGKTTSANIDSARELYRPAANRAAIIYFSMINLQKIHPMYQFSLKSFKVVFTRAIEEAQKTDDLKSRVLMLIDNITYSLFKHTMRALFEKHKLIFAIQLTFLIMIASREADSREIDFLLRFPIQTNVRSPVNFLSDHAWGAVRGLSISLNEFTHFSNDIEMSPKRWKTFIDYPYPEKEKFPSEWKNKTFIQKLCMLRCLRPDRMLYALKQFLLEYLGKKYVENLSIDLTTTFTEASSSTPLFFILSPGIDPIKDLENTGWRIKNIDKRRVHNISLGQGQEALSEIALEQASKEGDWVILQNIHLVATWLPTLEKLLEFYAENSHPSFRVFLSAEPAPDPQTHVIPQGILEMSIKITNEPPTGIRANLKKAFDNFTQETLEMCTRGSEFKTILFALCYFHACVCERRKFGTQGWNIMYPFSNGDLLICSNVLLNYLETNVKIPWDSLKYIIGDIMYGGHITDNWDRRLCKTYLNELINVRVLDSDHFLAPGFRTAPNTDYLGYQMYIESNLPNENPTLFGLHPNSEIEFQTLTSEFVLRSVFELQPRSSILIKASEMIISKEDKVRLRIEEILEKLPNEFNIRDLKARSSHRSPFHTIALQECERMNFLINEMKRSSRELLLGLKGELSMTVAMEDLQNSLFIEEVPANWERRAYPSMNSFAFWFADLLQRIRMLDIWTSDFILPHSIWISGLFSPQSFLTSIMQETSRQYELPLDKMCLKVEVTKRYFEEINQSPLEGVYLHGLFIEGARWDLSNDCIIDAKLNEINQAMPVFHISAVQIDKREQKNTYECPIYRTKERGSTFVWSFNLKTNENPTKWIIGGVCMLCSI